MNPSNWPSLVLLNIFKYFNLKEKSFLKEVCKNWRNELNQIQQSTFCFHEDPYPINLVFTISNDLVGYHNSTDTLNESSFLKFNSNLFNEIKKAYFPSVLFEEFLSLNFLNNFKLIEELELAGNADFQLDEPIELKLKKLKIISLQTCRIFRSSIEKDCYLKLDCPQLNTFSCWSSIENIKFNYPFKLKTIEIFEYDSSIKQFKNLETLIIMLFKKIDKSIRKNFKLLKELHLNITSLAYFDLNDLDKFKRYLEKKRIDVGISFFKAELRQYDKYDQDDKNEWYADWDEFRFNKFKIDDSNVVLIKNNYHKLKRINNWPFQVNYCNLIDKCPNLLSRDSVYDFCKKISNIQMVNVEFSLVPKVDETNLFRFLHSCKQLKYLNINESLIDQWFYDELYSLYTLEKLNIQNLSFYRHDKRNKNHLMLDLFGENLRTVEISIYGYGHRNHDINYYNNIKEIFYRIIDFNLIENFYFFRYHRLDHGRFNKYCLHYRKIDDTYIVNNDNRQIMTFNENDREQLFYYFKYFYE